MSIFATLNAEDKKTSFEIEGGNMEPIPAGTELKAMIEEAKWEESQRDGDEYVNLKWRVVDGEYNNRVVFQKVRINHPKGEANRKRALQMLFAIDAICGGKIAELSAFPSDDQLSAWLTMKPMAIKVEVWKTKNEMSGEDISGNWVKAVSALNAAKAKPAEKPEDDIDMPF